MTWRDSAARFRAEKIHPLTRYSTLTRVMRDDALVRPYNHLLSNQAPAARPEIIDIYYAYAVLLKGRQIVRMLLLVIAAVI